jgi:hypothetical protein
MTCIYWMPSGDTRNDAPYLKLTRSQSYYLVVMKQLTLFQAFARKSKLPLEITAVLHSFLPTDDELFCEQRFRYLLTNGLSEDEFSNDDIYCDFPYVMFCKTARYKIMLELDMDSSIRFNKRKFNPTLSITWHVADDHPTLQASRSVDLCPETEELSIENIARNLRKQHVPCILTAARLNEAMRHHFPTWYTRPVFDLTKITSDIFIEVPDFEKFGTERADGKKQFWPRVSVENLHLILR